MQILECLSENLVGKWQLPERSCLLLLDSKFKINFDKEIGVLHIKDWFMTGFCQNVCIRVYKILLDKSLGSTVGDHSLSTKGGGGYKRGRIHMYG